MILKTPLHAIKAPMNRITQDTMESMVESQAKRRKTPNIAATVPTKISM